MVTHAEVLNAEASGLLGHFSIKEVAIRIKYNYNKSSDVDARRRVISMRKANEREIKALAPHLA